MSALARYPLGLAVGGGLGLVDVPRLQLPRLEERASARE